MRSPSAFRIPPLRQVSPDPDPDLSDPYPDHHQNLITSSLTHFGHFLKVSSNSGSGSGLSYLGGGMRSPSALFIYLEKNLTFYGDFRTYKHSLYFSIILKTIK